jgi:hypothetical protein
MARGYALWFIALGLLLALLALGCGGSEPAAQAPRAPEPEAAPATEPATATAPSKPSASTDDAWEGEAEAKDPGSAEGKSSSSGAETRTNEVIALAIKGNRPAFRSCYEKTAQQLPDLEGTLTLHFVLDPDGKVKLAELNLERSTIKAPSVVDCAIGVLKAMKFPPSSRGMESVINYPFDFRR